MRAWARRKTLIARELTSGQERSQVIEGLVEARVELLLVVHAAFPELLGCWGEIR